MSDKKAPPANMDLIHMVQQARMQHDADAQPSKVVAVYWIEAKDQSGTQPGPTPRTGEWRIPTTLADVDALWERVKLATRAGQLGYKSKVSTRPAQGQGLADDRLICVRTYDADDRDDVARVEASLRAAGVQPLSYHRDHQS